MEFQLIFTQEAKEDIEFFKKSGNKSVLIKVNTLIVEMIVNPFVGIGKPEALKHELTGYWSRRINREHRLIYKVMNQAIIIHSLKGHY